MYKELKESEIKTASEIIRQYRHLAYIMLNPEEPVANGITLEPRGTLYAISDKEGLPELYEAKRKLKSRGIKNMLDTNPLFANEMFIML